MDNNDKALLQDVAIITGDQIKLHITYHNQLTLKELSEILNLTNKALNDINRQQGVKSNVVVGRNYPSLVSGVESGSIVLNIITNFIMPVTLNILASYIYERLKKIGGEKGNDKCKYPLNVYINQANNTIEISINNFENPRHI